MSLENGAASPDIATDVKQQVTPDELFGPMSPGRGHGYKDDTINSEKYQVTGDVFRDADQNVPSPTNYPETFLTSNSIEETSANERMAHSDSPYNNTAEKENHTGRPNKENVVKDFPSPAKSREAAYSRSKHSPASFKVSSMSVNRENVDRVRSRLHRDHNSLNGFSSRSSYLHVNIFDDNLNISNSKLDNTLLRLFSRNSNTIGPYADLDNPMESHNFAFSDFIGLEPVAWRIYPMNAAHKEILDREIDFISSHVKPREIISRLYKEGILTSLDYNQMARTAAQGDRAVTRLLIRTLQRRGAKAYPALINALLASDHFLVCERLSESEHELKSGMMTDRAQKYWANIQNGMYTTPNKLYTPHMGTSPDYAYNWSSFPNSTIFSPNQKFHVNETWPQANQRSLIDHSSPLYNTMPANPLLTPEGRDSQMLGTIRLEHRLNDVDRHLKMIHQDIASLRSDSTTHHNTRATGRESEAYLSPSGPLRQTMSLGQQEILHEHLQQQMNDLKRKMEKVHKDVTTLKSRDSVTDFPLLTQAMSGYHYGNVRESTNSRRIIDAEMLNSHMEALRSEIKLLHNDVTALKMARSFSVLPDRTIDTSRTLGKSTSRRHWDEPSLSPTRQTRPDDSVRDKSEGWHSDVIPGPLPHTMLPRYPSRYSPQFVYTGQYPDTPRSTSRADNLTRNSRNKTRADNFKPVSRDHSFNKSRSPEKKEEKRPSHKADDEPRTQENDIFNSKNGDNSYTDDNKGHNDDIYRSEDKREPVEKDALVNTGSNEILSPVENKDIAIDRNNINSTYNSGDDEDVFRELDRDNDKFDNELYGNTDGYRSKSRLDNKDENILTDSGEDDKSNTAKSDEETEKYRSKSRLDNKDNRMLDQEGFQQYPDDNYKSPVQPTNKTNTAEITKDAPHIDDRVITSPVPTPVDTERRQISSPNCNPEIVPQEKSKQTVSERIPEIVTQEKSHQMVSKRIPEIASPEKSPQIVSDRIPESVTPEKSPQIVSDRIPEIVSPEKSPQIVSDRIPEIASPEKSPQIVSDRIPEIVTPEKSPLLVSDLGSRNESPPNAPDNNQQPKQKKRVRYTSPLDDHNQTGERPKSKATNPADKKAVRTPPASSGDDRADRYRRPTSATDYPSSEDQDYIPILGPPDGVPFERVTTPYKILRNPNSRKMTTWSKKTDRARNIRRKAKI